MADSAQLSPCDSIFLDLASVPSRRWRWLSVSVAAHGVWLVWLLFPVTATYIRPSSLLAGNRGTLTTYVAFAPKSDSHMSLPEELMNENPQLVWQKPERTAKRWPGLPKSCTPHPQPPPIKPPQGPRSARSPTVQPTARKSAPPSVFLARSRACSPGNSPTWRKAISSLK